QHRRGRRRPAALRGPPRRRRAQHGGAPGAGGGRERDPRRPRDLPAGARRARPRARRAAGDAGQGAPAPRLAPARRRAPPPARARLAAVVDDPGVVEVLAGVLGLVPPVGVEETFWAVRRFLGALAARHPLVVVLDDLHWAQPTLLDLVEHLAQWGQNAPVLLI